MRRLPDNGCAIRGQIIQGTTRTRLRRYQRSYAHKLLQEQRQPFCGCRLRDLQTAYNRSYCSLRKAVVQSLDLPVDHEIGLLRILISSRLDATHSTHDCELVKLSLSHEDANDDKSKTLAKIRCQLLQRAHPMNTESYAPPRQRTLQRDSDVRAEGLQARRRDASSQTAE